MKKVCIYCGSALGTDKASIEAAAETGAMIARNGWEMLYGGAICGIMGAAADAALAQGGSVHGVIPSFFDDYNFEVVHPHLTKLTKVKTMPERKAILLEESDAFVALSGGFGTMDELFETLVLIQLKQATGHVYLLNTNGFYDPMLEQFDKMEEAGLLHSEVRALLTVVTTPKELEQELIKVL